MRPTGGACMFKCNVFDRGYIRSPEKEKRTVKSIGSPYVLRLPSFFFRKLPVYEAQFINILLLCIMRLVLYISPLYLIPNHKDYFLLFLLKVFSFRFYIIWLYIPCWVKFCTRREFWVAFFIGIRLCDYTGCALTGLSCFSANQLTKFGWISFRTLLVHWFMCLIFHHNHTVVITVAS